MSSGMNQGHRRATTLGLTFMGLAFLALGAILLGGCTAKPAGTNDAPAGATAAGSFTAADVDLLRSENALLKDRVAKLERENRRLGAEVAAAKPMTEPITINYQSYPSNRRLIVREGAQVLERPKDGALGAIGATTGPGTLVDVIQAANVEGEIWLYVGTPAYNSPANNCGWIREADTEPLTKSNVTKVRANLYLKTGTLVWENLSDFADITKIKPEPLPYDDTGGLTERRDGYAHLQMAGGRDVWVEEKYLVYPDVE